MRINWRSRISDMTSYFQDGGHGVISHSHLLTPRRVLIFLLIWPICMNPIGPYERFMFDIEESQQMSLSLDPHEYGLLLSESDKLCSVAQNSRTADGAQFVA